MIEVYFNLKKTPFPKDIAPTDIFASECTRELRQRLEYLKQHRGIMLLTGAPGAGKTVQLRAFADSLNRNLYHYFYLPLSTVNILDFYRQLAANLGVEPPYRKAQLFVCIQSAIRDYVENRKKIPVIIFDEAHLFMNENFSELQIITNFHFDSIDPAIFILSGQPHLRDRLLGPVYQSFNQRILLKFHLTPLSKEETESYVNHQMHLAGAKSPIFNQSALCAIYQVSAGVCRLINKLALKTLTIGALEKKDTLTEEEVYRASKEL
ncbi:MAG: AAA family ATPase [Thermodesulfobacteriota bacterium]